MFEVESNVPTPPVNEGRPGHSKYPLRDMEIGDSFGFPYDDVKLVRSAIGTYNRRHEGKFIVRKVDGGARCWRVE